MASESAASAATATAPSTRTLTIDPNHSEATFQVRHLITKVRGTFGQFAGTIEFDEAHPERSSVNFTIETSSIDTNQADRDQHLRSEDFFHVEKFPAITFKSTDIKAQAKNQLEVRGQLTIRGVTKEITLPVTFLGLAKDPWGKERAGFEADVTLNRKDFGLTWNAALETGGFLVGDDVRVMLSIQAVAQ
jgi:polyisoprenoid-binding protein YceI